MVTKRTLIFLAVYLICSIFSTQFILNSKDLNYSSNSNNTHRGVFLNLFPNSLVFKGTKDIVKKEQKLEPGILSDKNYLAISYDLHGVCLFNGQASAIILVTKNNKSFSISLADYGTNCALGEQRIIVPFSHFSIDEPLKNLTSIQVQFWHPALYSIKITKIEAHSSDSSFMAESQRYNSSAQIISQLITPTPAPVNQPPIAIATANIIRTSIPAPVEFRGYQSYDPEKNPLTYRWTFGDGNAVNSANANHTFSKAGIYIAQFSVSDGISLTMATPITIKVGIVPTPTPTPTPPPTPTNSPLPTPTPTPPPTSTSTPVPGNQPPVAIATANPLNGPTAPLGVEFRGFRSYDPEGKPLTYRWTLGDSNTVNNANANHTYLKAGKYVAQFSVSDGVNLTLATPITIQVGIASSPTQTPSTTSTATPIPSEWTFCSNEDSFCSFSETKEVRYGLNGSYYYKTLPNGTPCTNTVFGDPIQGVVKQCHYRNVLAGVPSPTPSPITTPTPTPQPVSQSWPIRSVSSMKVTKDTICGQPSQTFINSWISKAIELGANYIAVETPYDNPACGNSVLYTKMWVDTIHARGLNVWHRHMPLAFEGIYDTPKNNTFNYVGLISNYITAHPTFFKAGDIFTPIPEPQNGGILGITYCPQNICIFPSASNFNAWLRDAMTNSEIAFTAIGLRGQIKIGYYGFDGFVAWGDNNPDWDGILEAATIQAMGNITIDHYPEIVGDTMENDLNELQARYPGVPIVIGEWGTITSTDLVGQVNKSMQAALRPGVVGFNYWHMGMGGNEALINDDFTNRINFAPVKSFFTR